MSKTFRQVYRLLCSRGLRTTPKPPQTDGLVENYRTLKSMKEEVELMILLGVIKPSTGDWSSPVVLVPRKDGSIHFCID